MQTEGLLDRKALSKLTGLSENFFAKASITGDGPVMIKIGRAVRYDPADVKAWLDARRVRSTSEAA